MRVWEWAALAVCLIGAIAWAWPARSVVEDAALQFMTMGLDTATTEGSFCLGWHLDVTKHGPFGVDSAFHVTAARRPAYDGPREGRWRDSTKYHCPLGQTTAHWHLLSKNHVDGPSVVDELSLIDMNAPFGLVIVRELDSTKFHVVTYVNDSSQADEWRARLQEWRDSVAAAQKHAP